MKLKSKNYIKRRYTEEEKKEWAKKMQEKREARRLLSMQRPKPDISSNDIEKIFQQPLMTQRKYHYIRYRPNNDRPLSRNARRVVTELNLNEERDVETRALYVIGYLRMKNYTYKTAASYFFELRARNYFGDKCTLRPKATHFEGKTQMRVVTDKEYQTLFSYLLLNINISNIPLIIGIITGLRGSEILKFDTLTLHELNIQKPTMSSVTRKSTTRKLINWTPIYAPILMNFVRDYMINLFYKEQYDLFMTKGVNSKLFHIRVDTLTKRFKAAFVLATGTRPPSGFGIHTCRYNTAALIANNTYNLHIIQKFLGHATIEMTTKYLKQNNSNITRVVNECTADIFKKFIDSTDNEITNVANPTTTTTDGS